MILWYRQIERLLAAININFWKVKYNRESSNKRSQINNQNINTVVKLESSRSAKNDQSQSVIVNIKSNTMHSKNGSNQLLTKMSLKEYLRPIRMVSKENKISVRKEYNTKARTQQNTFIQTQSWHNHKSQNAKNWVFWKRKQNAKSNTKGKQKHYRPSLLNKQSSEVKPYTGIFWFTSW